MTGIITKPEPYPFGNEYLCPYCGQWVVLTMPDDWKQFMDKEINCPNCNETGLLLWNELFDGYEYIFVRKDYYD